MEKFMGIRVLFMVQNFVFPGVAVIFAVLLDMMIPIVLEY